MYLWKFRANPAWRAAHEEACEENYSGEVAVTSLPGKARALFQVTCRSKAQAQRLVRQFGGTVEKLPRNWQTKFLGNAKRAPLRIGQRLVVVAEPDPPERSEQLIIPAAGAFGTGEHATTALCLRMLEETSRKLPAGWSLLDAGTGTGILALAARHFGAKKVLGIDNDPRAVAHARQNARRNKIRGARFVRLNFLDWKPPQRYEMISANLFSELLIQALPIFRRTLQSGGTVILSGILREQAPKVIRELGRAGFVLDRQRRRGKWIALRCHPR
ncbi:MAG: 50S ribosomal protein L11 methyltransferase [Chthoniobacterales bacterium]